MDKNREHLADEIQVPNKVQRGDRKTKNHPFCSVLEPLGWLKAQTK